MLINKLIELFGIDSQNKGYYDLEKEINIDIREWNYKDVNIKFGEGYNNGGQCLLLDISF